MTGLEFAAVAIIGVLVGRFLPNRRKGPKPAPEPVCGCEHHHSYHDRSTGACGWEGTRFIGTVNGIAQYAATGCACRSYSGPVPLPEYYAPEVTA